MDYIGYLSSNKFILIVADTRFRVTVGEIALNTDQARKVYQLDDHILLSVVGNLHKTTDIRKYLSEIRRLRPDESFEELLDHLQDAFNVNQAGIDETRRLLALTKQSMDLKKEVDIPAFVQSLEGQPDLLAFVTDALSSLRAGVRHPTTALVFGVEPNSKTLRTAKYAMIGGLMNGGEVLPIAPGNFAFEFISSTHSTERINEVGGAMLDIVRPYIIDGWEESEEATNTLKTVARNCLLLGLRQLNPYADPAEDTDFVHYEISADTDYKINGPIPNRKLLDVTINRSNPPTV